MTDETPDDDCPPFLLADATPLPGAEPDADGCTESLFELSGFHTLAGAEAWVRDHPLEDPTRSRFIYTGETAARLWADSKAAEAREREAAEAGGEAS
jgi:hypothetical protein